MIPHMTFSFAFSLSKKLRSEQSVPWTTRWYRWNQPTNSLQVGSSGSSPFRIPAEWGQADLLFYACTNAPCSRKTEIVCHRAMPLLSSTPKCPALTPPSPSRWMNGCKLFFEESYHMFASEDGKMIGFYHCIKTQIYKGGYKNIRLLSKKFCLLHPLSTRLWLHNFMRYNDSRRMTSGQKAASGGANPSSHRQAAVLSDLRLVLRCNFYFFCDFNLCLFQ